MSCRSGICWRRIGIALQSFFYGPQGFIFGPAGSRLVSLGVRRLYPAALQRWCLGSGIWWFLSFFSSFFLMLVSWLQAEEGGAVAEDSWRKSSPRRGRSSQTRSREKMEGCRGGAGKRRTAAPTGRRERTEGERRAGAHSETSMLLWWNFCASLAGSELVEQHLLCST